MHTRAFDSRESSTQIKGEIKLPYGLRDGRLLHISEVSSGLACKCICPSCESLLIAKKCEDRRSHFAHAAEADCKGALEFALHLLAKEVITAKKKIVVPRKLVRFKGNDEVFPSKYFSIASASTEVRVTADVIPDSLIEIEGVKVALEIFVTH